MVEDKYYFDKKVFSKQDYKLSLDYEEELLKTILDKPSGKKVLDLGCGDSGLSIELAKIGYKVTLVDISDSLMKKLKENLSKMNIPINLVKSDLDSFKFKDNWDIIIFTGVSHFIKNPKKLIKNIQTHTSPGGINVLDILIVDSKEESFLNKIYSPWKILEKSIHHEDFGEFIFFLASKS